MLLQESHLSPTINPHMFDLPSLSELTNHSPRALDKMSNSIRKDKTIRPKMHLRRSYKHIFGSYADPKVSAVNYTPNRTYKMIYGDNPKANGPKLAFSPSGRGKRDSKANKGNAGKRRWDIAGLGDHDDYLKKRKDWVYGSGKKLDVNRFRDMDKKSDNTMSRIGNFQAILERRRARKHMKSKSGSGKGKRSKKRSQKSSKSSKRKSTKKKKKTKGKVTPAAVVVAAVVADEEKKPEKYLEGNPWDLNFDYKKLLEQNCFGFELDKNEFKTMMSQEVYANSTSTMTDMDAVEPYVTTYYPNIAPKMIFFPLLASLFDSKKTPSSEVKHFNFMIKEADEKMFNDMKAQTFEGIKYWERFAIYKNRLYAALMELKNLRLLNYERLCDEDDPWKPRPEPPKKKKEEEDVVAAGVVGKGKKSKGDKDKNKDKNKDKDRVKNKLRERIGKSLIGGRGRNSGRDQRRYMNDLKNRRKEMKNFDYEIRIIKGKYEKIYGKEAKRTKQSGRRKRRRRPNRGDGSNSRRKSRSKRNKRNKRGKRNRRNKRGKRYKADASLRRQNLARRKRLNSLRRNRRGKNNRNNRNNNGRGKNRKGGRFGDKNSLRSRWRRRNGLKKGPKRERILSALNDDSIGDEELKAAILEEFRHELDLKGKDKSNRGPKERQLKEEDENYEDIKHSLVIDVLKESLKELFQGGDTKQMREMAKKFFFHDEKEKDNNGGKGIKERKLSMMQEMFNYYGDDKNRALKGEKEKEDEYEDEKEGDDAKSKDKADADKKKGKLIIA